MMNLYEDSIVIDALGGSVLDRPSPLVNGQDIIGQRIAGGITVSNETVAANEEDFRSAVNKIYFYRTLATTERARLEIVETVDDIARLKKEGKHGLLLGFQDAAPFEGDVKAVFTFQKLGLRISGLAYNARTILGDGCYEKWDQGLTVHGHRIVNAMNEAGITVDLSHVGSKTALDATQVSSKPVIYSHSNCSALTDHVRNISDKQILAVAEKGGVVGIGPHSVFCETQPGTRPTFEDFLAHFRHVIDLVGVDHVGIGTDMFGGETLGERTFRAHFSRIAPSFFGGYSIDEKYVRGFSAPSAFPRLADGLNDLGLNDTDVQKVLGGNFLRVFEATWA